MKSIMKFILPMVAVAIVVFGVQALIVFMITSGLGIAFKLQYILVTMGITILLQMGTTNNAPVK